MFYPITINGPEDAMKLNKLASEEDYALTIHDTLTSIDARSLLALFTLIGRTVNLVAPDHIDPQKFVALVERTGLRAI